MLEATHAASTILVVEDDSNFRNLLVSLFQDGGHDVLSASNGLEALDLLQARCGLVHALLTDIQMPHKGGLELMQEIHARGWSIPTVAMTGTGNKELLIQLLRLGVEDFLEKPFGLAEVRQRIEAVFSRASRRQGLTGIRRILDEGDLRLDRHPEKVRGLIEGLRDQLDAHMARGEGLVSLVQQTPVVSVAWRVRKILDFGATVAVHREGDHSFSLLLARPVGHDHKALEQGVMVRILFDASYAQCPDPEEFLRRLGRILFQQQVVHPVEAIVVQIDSHSGTASVASAGFPTPYHLPANGRTRSVLSGTGGPLGENPQAEVHSADFSFLPGDRLVMTCPWLPRLSRIHPTGAAMPLGGTGLEELIQPHRSRDLPDLVNNLWNDALAFSGWHSREDLLLVGLELLTAVEASS